MNQVARARLTRTNTWLNKNALLRISIQGLDDGVASALIWRQFDLEVISDDIYRKVWNIDDSGE